MPNEPNEITFCRDVYDSDAKMWADIATTLRTLVQNEYIATVHCDEPGIGVYVIKFDYFDESMCETYPYWLTPEEYEKILLLDEGEENAE